MSVFLISLVSSLAVFTCASFELGKMKMLLTSQASQKNKEHIRSCRDEPQSARLNHETFGQVHFYGLPEGHASGSCHCKTQFANATRWEQMFACFYQATALIHPSASCIWLAQSRIGHERRSGWSSRPNLVTFFPRNGCLNPDYVPHG